MGEIGVKNWGNFILLTVPQKCWFITVYQWISFKSIYFRSQVTERTIQQSYGNQNSMVLAQKQTYRLMEQNGEAEISPHRQSQLIPNKGSKNVQWRKENLFSNQHWENCTATCKRIIQDYFLIPCIKINSTWTLM